MRRLTLLLLLPFFSFEGSAQNEYLDYKYSLSVNALFTHNLTSPYGLYEKTASLSGMTSSFFIMTERRNQHEISLEQLSIGSSSYYYDENVLQSNRGLNVSLGYKYLFNFMKRKTSRWIPSVGLGAHVFYRTIDFSPTEAIPFIIRYRGGGLQFYVQPMITCHINHRLYLNFSIPVNIATTELRSDYYDNPEIPAEQRNITVLKSNGFYQFQGKIGFGVKF